MPGCVGGQALALLDLPGAHARSSGAGAEEAQHGVLSTSMITRMPSAAASLTRRSAKASAGWFGLVRPGRLQIGPRHFGAYDLWHGAPAPGRSRGRLRAADWGRRRRVHPAEGRRGRPTCVLGVVWVRDRLGIARRRCEPREHAQSQHQRRPQRRRPGQLAQAADHSQYDSDTSRRRRAVGRAVGCSRRCLPSGSGPRWRLSCSC